MRDNIPHTRHFVLDLLQYLDYTLLPLHFIQSHENDRRLALIATRQNGCNMYNFNVMLVQDERFLLLACPSKGARLALMRWMESGEVRLGKLSLIPVDILGPILRKAVSMALFD